MSDYDPNYKQKKTYFLVGQKAILLNENDQILLLKRSDKVSASGKWNLPGGAIEEGENAYESILREISEETELVVDDLRPFSVKSYKNEDNTIIIGYKGSIKTPEVKLNWEHDEFKWASKDQALTMDITDVTRLFIEYYDK